MSKKCKSAAKERRKREKRARKAAQQAQYDRWRSEGINSKSRRAKAKRKSSRKVRTERHADGDCGNVGCTRCTMTKYSAVAVARRFPHKIPHGVWLKMQAWS